MGASLRDRHHPVWGCNMYGWNQSGRQNRNPSRNQSGRQTQNPSQSESESDLTSELLHHKKSVTGKRRRKEPHLLASGLLDPSGQCYVTLTHTAGQVGQRELAILLFTRQNNSGQIFEIARSKTVIDDSFANKACWPPSLCAPLPRPGRRGGSLSARDLPVPLRVRMK